MEKRRRTLLLSCLIVGLLMLHYASAIELAPVFSKDREDKGSKKNNSASSSVSSGSSSNSGKGIGSHSEVEVQARGTIVGGSLDGAQIKVEAKAKFKPDGTFQEGRVEVKIQKGDAKIELNLPASPDSHLHPPTTGDHTGLSGCAIPNPSAHIVTNMVTALNLQIIGGTSTSNVALQGLAPILGTYTDLLCLTGKTQIAGK